MNEFKFDPYKALHSIVKTTSAYVAEDFLESICFELKKLFDADLIFITQAIEIKPTKNVKIIASTQTDLNNVEFDLDDTPCKLIYDEGVVSIEKDVYLNFEKSKTFGWESFLGLPIYNEERICIGHISIFSSKQRKYDNEIIEIAKVFSGRIETEARRIALEKEKNEVLEKLYIQSITDELTKVYNRRYFMKKVKQLYKLSKRDVCTLTLAVLDIDNFKTLNDTYGHDEGDYVLKKIGKVFKSHNRENVDFIFRTGGEEFAIISLDNGDISNYLEHILKKITTIFEDKPYDITFSIGVTKLNEKHDCWGSLYKDADEKMYQAKRSGKNRIVY